MYIFINKKRIKHKNVRNMYIFINKNVIKHKNVVKT